MRASGEKSLRTGLALSLLSLVVAGCGSRIQTPPSQVVPLF